jgi:hypothetical protein
MRILAILKENSGCDYHRILLPFSYMEWREGDSFDFFTDSQMLQEEDFKKYDIVYFNRTPHFSHTVFLQLKKKYGFKTVCDVDDYWHLNVNHYMYSGWNASGMQKLIPECLTAADLCIVTNKQLQDQVLQINNNCIVIPNALPFGFGQFNDQKIMMDKVNILYAGGKSHLMDVKTIQEVFVRLPKESMVTLAGYSDKTDSDRTIWTRIENMMKRCSHFRKKRSLPLDSYMDHYTDANISIAPLQNNSFNSYKSNLKLLEAGCKKIPIVLSDVPAYWQDEEMHDKGARFCDSVSNWVQSLAKLSKSLSMREDYGNILGEYVRTNYNLFNWNPQRYYQLEKLLR